MICLTKEETTYLSFIPCLNREIPGFSEHLHATGTDGERALINALGAGFQRAAPLLCYIHTERKVRAKGRKLGLSSALVERICQDLYQQGSSLIWSSSREAFDVRAKVLMEEWILWRDQRRVVHQCLQNTSEHTSWKICRPGWQGM